MSSHKSRCFKTASRSSAASPSRRGQDLVITADTRVPNFHRSCLEILSSTLVWDWQAELTASTAHFWKHRDTRSSRSVASQWGLQKAEICTSGFSCNHTGASGPPSSRGGRPPAAGTRTLFSARRPRPARPAPPPRGSRRHTAGLGPTQRDTQRDSGPQKPLVPRADQLGQENQCRPPGFCFPQASFSSYASACPVKKRTPTSLGPQALTKGKPLLFPCLSPGLARLQSPTGHVELLRVGARLPIPVGFPAGTNAPPSSRGCPL
uniref:Uncharacterized protein n=1 Tax=Mustela putorius furo TaxID=9669 RepID=M3YL52_MUSPF